MSGRGYGKSRSYSGSGKGMGRFDPSLFPICFILAILPLITVRCEVFCNLNSLPFYDSMTENVNDYFLYGKMVAFVITAFVMAAFTAYRLFKDGKKIRFDRIFIPVGVYALLSFLSAVFSEHSDVSFSGSIELYENVWVLMGYALTAYYAYLCVNSEDDVRVLMTALLVGVVLEAAVGVSQALGHDFFGTSLGTRLLGMKDVSGLTYSDGAGASYGTLFNSNYVGSYITLVVVLLATAGLPFKGIKKAIGTAAGVVLAVGSIIMLAGSESLTGFIAVGASFTLFILVRILSIKKKYMWIPALTVVLLLLGVFAFNKAVDGALTDKIDAYVAGIEDEMERVGRRVITKIETLEDCVIVTARGEETKLSYSYNGADGTVNITVCDPDGNECQLRRLSEEGEQLWLMVESGPMIGATLEFPFVVSAEGEERQYGIKLYMDEEAWYFTDLSGDEGYVQVIYPGKYMKAQQGEYVEALKKYGRVATGRVFIWSGTIPLLKENILLGSGPDTFAYEFPNYDVVALSKYNGQYVINCKPHNMYLQMGVQTGVLSLIAFLTFYLIYFIRSMSLYARKHEKTFLSRVGVGILCGTFGYMVAGLANDSMICVAPVFWALMGIGIAVNTLVRR